MFVWTGIAERAVALLEGIADGPAGVEAETIFALEEVVEAEVEMRLVVWLQDALGKRQGGGCGGGGGGGCRGRPTGGLLLELDGHEVAAGAEGPVCSKDGERVCCLL